MIGAHRMHELEYFAGGATLVISVGGLNWLSQRRRSDRGIKKRGEEQRLWMSVGRMIEADEDRCPVTCFCALDGGRSDAIESLRCINRRPRLTASSSSCRLPEELFQQSTCASSDPFITDVPKEIAWTKFTLNLPDVSSLIPMALNTTPHQDIAAKHLYRRFIVLCGDQTPAQLFSDICSTQDCRTLMMCPDRPARDGMSVELTDPAAQWTPGPGSSSEEELSEADGRQNLNSRSHRGLLKPVQDRSPPGASCTGVKLRKSVSFDDDVMVYLFDQERPTLELQSEPCSSLSSNFSCNLQSFSVKDDGLEWEDDFSALEQSCRLQCARPARQSSRSPPSPSRAALQRPERRRPPQRCLFLTYVTEADLEL